MTELVLSNATSFFSGSLEKLFQNAKKYGFRYVEIAPYRWSNPKEIVDLQKRYKIQVAGIHLPFTSADQTLLEELKRNFSLMELIFIPIFRFYLGNISQNPGLEIATALSANRPYLLIHSDISRQLGAKFEDLKKHFHVVIENVPEDRNIVSGGVFDHNHFLLSKKKFPELSSLEAYRQAKPEVIHISYDNLLPASLPNTHQQNELKTLMQVHKPKYITLETNPLVSIKKGKLLLEKILDLASTSATGG